MEAIRIYYQFAEYIYAYSHFRLRDLSGIAGYPDRVVGGPALEGRRAKIEQR
jgi:hypothetical protein